MDLKKSLYYVSILVVLLFFSSCTEIVTGLSNTRKPTVAGSFHPAEKKELSSTVDQLLSDAYFNNNTEGELWGLIAPHAAYNYSGKIAAQAFKQIIGKNYETVIILASSHYMKYDGIAIYPKGFWETPLGVIPVDEQIAMELKKKNSYLKNYYLPFFNEHSIEAQLPFLQRTLENFKIVPILFGQNIEDEEYRILAEQLTNLIKEKNGKILILASTDLSHYHDYLRAKIMDGIAIKNIINLEKEKLITNLEQRNCEMCGAAAVITLLQIAQTLPTNVVLLNYSNSGDTVGNKDSVVGYAAIAMYLSKDATLINVKEQKTLLKLARKTLEKYVRTREIPDYDAVDDKLKIKSGIFVTLKKNNELRGCIGTTVPEKTLIDGVIDMTIASATRDPRFAKVSPSELSDIKIEISILSPLKKINDIEEIEVGKHGLYLCNGLKCGLLLPQIAVENNWNREKFLEMVSLKAGLPPSAWKEKDSEIYIFTAQVFSEE